MNGEAKTRVIVILTSAYCTRKTCFPILSFWFCVPPVLYMINSEDVPFYSSAVYGLNCYICYIHHSDGALSMNFELLIHNYQGVNFNLFFVPV